ncbi:MAG: hypothetical protein DRP81_06845 [Candidatus Omnitrophota bacterium]|nr:MAG: hypothetical protein DRP81_06845 [Candidatus Omnitrophota bacterium]
MADNTSWGQSDISCIPLLFSSSSTSFNTFNLSSSFCILLQTHPLPPPSLEKFVQRIRRLG